MLKLISSLGLALALADLKRRIRHWVRSGILGAVGAALTIVAICFLLVAAHLYLSSVLNPIASAAIIGGVLLLIALILFFLASRPLKPPARPAHAADTTANVGDALREGMARLGEAAGSTGSPLRSPLFQAAATALVAGFFLGRRSKRASEDD